MLRSLLRGYLMFRLGRVERFRDLRIAECGRNPVRADRITERTLGYVGEWCHRIFSEGCGGLSAPSLGDTVR
ncbi:MAG: hypothetical protein RL240_4400 [Planctomycetota bacterium]